jgi:mono/diheme cytochrome c family protein
LREKMGSIAAILVIILLSLSCQNNSGNNNNEEEFLAADGYRGGKLYDEFWAEETGYTSPDNTIFDAKPDFFRCVQCHGWDLLGQGGGYARYFPSATRPNVVNLNLYAVAQAYANDQLFKAIQTGNNPALRRSKTTDLSMYDPKTNNVTGDQMPNYSDVLTDKDIWDIVRFLKTEAVDVHQLYDFTVDGSYPNATVTFSNIGKDGNATQGNTIYANECSSNECHGADGTENAGMATVGDFHRVMPYKDAYIIKFGVLGTGMGEEVLTLQQLKDLFKALADSTMYP